MIAALSIAALFSGLVAALPPRYGGVLQSPLSCEPATLDPLLAWRRCDAQVVTLLYDTLYREGRSGPEPLLAAAMPEPDGDRLVVRVRTVRLPGGGVLDARDAAASLLRVLRSPVGRDLAPVREVRAESAERLIFTTRKTLLPEDLAGWLTPSFASVLPGGVPGTAGVARGSGPFLDAGRGADRWSLRANDAHPAGRPYLDRLDLRWFRRAADEEAAFSAGPPHGPHITLRASRSLSGRAIDMTRSAGLAVSLVLWGRARPLLAQKDVRAALAGAVNRGQSSRIRPPGKAPNLAPARVRALARYPEIGGGPPLSLLWDASSPEAEQDASGVAADLDAVGVRVRLVATEPAELIARVADCSFDLAVLEGANDVSERVPACAFSAPVQLRGLQAGFHPPVRGLTLDPSGLFPYADVRLAQ